tara:strand:+ start:300 stop:998 length:699 start_codon:yes stop_codon:yes gene_type:complete
MELSSSHKIIRVEGIDSLEFLQGQLSNDLNLANKDILQKNVICNLRGQIISLIWLKKQSEESFDLILDGSIIDKTFDTLKKYKVFFKSEMFIIDEVSKHAEIVDFAKWKSNCINNGLCEINSLTSELFTPHDLGYQNLDVINFEKGCYTGQEVVARMHYRAKLKTGLLLIYSSDLNSMKEGSSLYDKENKVLGKIASKFETNSLIFLKNKSNLKDIYKDSGEKINFKRLKLF